ncbi:probable cytochrome P450 6d5 [Phlebotomus argentipes]|uniref:probable cytochrome P450 6d5 n=1 Tax=Phlebotomus argentipes TaxID=94469 RepID=UPI002892BE59|nr:probable cytochrome P450 6d5 [Phlebotomus argentipes]
MLTLYSQNQSSLISALLYKNPKTIVSASQLKFGSATVNMALIFDSVLLDIAALLSFCAVGLYFYFKHIYSYWDRRNVKSIKPVIPFGNIKDAILLKTTFAENFVDIYNSTDEPVIGVYAINQPGLMIRDIHLVRSIMIKDFQYFHDRGVNVNEDIDPLSGHLFSLPGEKWKNLRSKLTPTFTSGRIKAMFQTFLDCGKSLEAHLTKNSDANTEVEMRNLMACYATNIIASVAFGLETDTIIEPEATFRIMGRKFFDPTLKNLFRFTCTFILPRFGKMLNVKSVDNDYEAFIFKMVKDTMDYREKNNIIRKDFMQLLLQLKHTGKVDYEDSWNFEKSKNGDVKNISFEELAAQAHVFFLAGFETTSTTMSFCFYELAKNPDIQAKVQTEIDEVTKKYDGKITYESVNEMKYLESCIDETLRMYGPVPVLNRECTREYKLPGTNITVEKGTRIFIPSHAIQNDPKHFPDPDTFKPERFSTDEWNSAGGLKYMPFGDGPRACIGLRMGKLQAKIGIVLILSKFNIHLGERLQKMKKFKYELKSFTPAIEGGMHVKVTRRTH